MDSASIGRSDRSRLRQAIGPLNGPTARGTVLQWAVLAATVLAAVIACEAPAPTAAPNALAHFRNHTGRALLISLDSGTFQFTHVLLPCAGELSVAVPPPPEEDPRVVMGALQDPALDVMVQRGEASEEADLRDRHWANAAIVWSTGEIGVSDLPRWITFRPAAADVSASHPADSPPPDCEPWRPPG